MNKSTFLPKLPKNNPGFRAQRMALPALVALSSLAWPRAHAAPPPHHISAGNMTVIQNDNLNNVTSVTTFLTLSINDFRVRGAGGAGSDSLAPLNSKGDFAVQIGPDATNQFLNGILMSSVTQNGRDNGEGTNNYCVSMIEAQRLRLTNTFDPGVIIGAYWIPVNNANNTGGGGSDEYNINVAGAYFPYTEFIGGFARNSGDANGNNPTNGSATAPFVLNELISSPGLVLGSNFIDLGNGTMFVTLTNFGIDSRANGIMLVSGAKNESANFALCQVNTNNGGWNLWIKDNGAGTIGTFEEDPIAFVFIPKTNTTVVSGRFTSGAAIDAFSGNSAGFTVTSNSAGTYELKITGKSPTNGVLIISAEGGRVVNRDNMVSYQTNGAGDGYIIQSRDTPGNGLEAIPAPEPVVSFVYIPAATFGFTVTPTNNLLTTENGGTDTFTVVLDRPPAADVTIPISSSNTSEGTVSPSSLTFNSTNWNVPQTVTVQGVDDATVDGSVFYTIVLGAASSADVNYNGLDPADVSVENADNESGITVSPTSGLITTEAGGTATFDVHLNSQPSANVTISLSSSDLTEGTVSPATLTFTSLNWSNDQTVTITGVNDFIVDGNIAYTIITSPSSSTDPLYNGVNPRDVSVVNTDDDVAGVTVSAAGPAGLSVIEGKTNTYTVVLTSQPAASVTVNVTSSNTSQGGTVSPASLIFTSGNWSNAQTVKVIGTDDLASDGTTTWTVTNSFSSSDPLYAAIAPIPVLMSTLDNEAAITLPSGTLIYGIGLAGVGIDGRAIIGDTNSASYNAGTLTVTLTANGTSDDRLEIRNTGTGAGQIGVSGSSVSYSGTAIGSFTGGSGVTPLLVTFNSSATPAAAQALLRNVTFRNVNASPSLNTRTVSVVLAHADGGTGSATESIRVGLLRYSDFQEGLDHGYGIYSGEADIALRQADPSTPYPAGSAGGLFIDYPVAGQFNAWQVLMEFTNMFGTGFGQIPTNAVIVSAELVLTVPIADANGSGDGSPLYRMLIDWDPQNETWANKINGVDQDDAESRSVADSQFGVIDGSGSTGFGAITMAVTPDIEAWRAGAPNFGWVMPGWFTNTDGTTISPGEAAIENDRPRLRVLWLPANTPSASFRQNVNGYASAVDTDVRADQPDTSFATAQTAFVDWAIVGTSSNEHVLVRFDNIIGTAANQIPPGSQVHAAILELASTGNNHMGHGGSFHVMLQPWQDTSTWNSLVNGVSADGVEAVVDNSATAGTAALTPLISGGYHEFEMTADVQSWVSGTRPNYGWVALPWTNGTDGWGFGTSDNATEGNRPQLRLYYTPALAITSIVRGPTSATIQFVGPPGNVCTVRRALTVTGTYSTIGSATIQPDSTASFTDISPPPGAAFYRIYFP